jgi:uncharacterized protein (DUF1330 family)
MARVAVTLCVLLWARAGREADLGRYEDEVLALLADHGGRVVQRARVEGAQVEGASGQPAEVQILQFASDAALEEDMNDPRRTALAAQRDEAIARTDVLRATLLS